MSENTTPLQTAHETDEPPVHKPEQELNPAHIAKIAVELQINARQVMATATLLKEKATVPFIARYRKEATGELDEVAITSIRDRITQLEELDERRTAILKSLDERNLLTDELRKSVNAAHTMAVLEDIYLPFRPKRRTRATIAREKGLEPLADALLAAQESGAAFDLVAEAQAFLSEEKGVASTDEALAGARDILAERFNEDAKARARLREFFAAKSAFKSKVLSDKEAEGIKFKDYYDWSEPLVNAPSHRVLAIRRGEKEGFLSLRITPPDDEGTGLLESLFVKGHGPAADQIRLAAQDSYKRLLALSMETEMRLESKKKADTEAIRVFAENLRELLLAAPLGQRSVMAIDPGFRTGCKVVCLDPQGKLLHNDVIYPTQSDHLKTQAEHTVLAMCERFGVQAIAIGNGTAGRETESFIRGLNVPKSIPVVMVNESGASIYSASEVAREEFPDHDITVRGAVSIGRRLMDPLAELVKIDPKSIGVGQYQHDVDQGALKRSLDDVVESCVNNVGVEVNTASRQLLTYVSGLGSTLAGNIVNYRNQNGAFHSREELKKVTRLGPKAFEQAAGFLRVRDAVHPLDSSAVHPESYPIVDKMARDLNCSVADLMHNESLRRQIQLEKYVTEKVGLPTLKDILSELAKPGRDPRQQFEAFSFDDSVQKMEDLTPGMKLPGIVTNVTAFGAFVDIGVHQDGLVHVSQLADRFVKDPSEVVKVQQRVMVTVMEVDIPRKRIGLSMKSKPEMIRQEKQEKTEATERPNTPKGPRPPQAAQKKPTPPQPQRPAKENWFTEAMKKAK